MLQSLKTTGKHQGIDPRTCKDLLRMYSQFIAARTEGGEDIKRKRLKQPSNRICKKKKREGEDNYVEDTSLHPSLHNHPLQGETKTLNRQSNIKKKRRKKKKNETERTITWRTHLCIHLFKHIAAAIPCKGKHERDKQHLPEKKKKREREDN